MWLRLLVILGCVQVAASLLLSSVLAQAPAAATRDDASDSEPQGEASSESDEKLPPPLQRYKGRKIAPVMGYQGAAWLMRSERVQEENPQKLLESLSIKPGQTICDLGCGSGYYTLELARRVGSEGKVLAVDIQPEMLRLLELNAHQSGLKNIELVLNSPVDPKLPANSVDLILLVDVYHEFSYPEHMLQAMRKSLKPDGRIVLVEFRGEDPTVPIKPLHKMTKQQVHRELEPNGYKLVEEFDELPWQHVMFFGKASEAETAAAITAQEEEDAAAQQRRDELRKARDARAAEK
jgi:ubiquinone/menaquinone biosynthesis C-methylase UbiE